MIRVGFINIFAVREWLVGDRRTEHVGVRPQEGAKQRGRVAPCVLRRLDDRRQRARGVLDSFRLRLFGLPFEQRAYANILRNLGAGGYRDRELGESGAIDYGDAHFTCFQFSYDWRRDNAENAARLHAFILETREHVRAELLARFGVDKPDLRFDLVAHSMGGLLSRYFLRYGAAPLPDDGSLPELTWAGSTLVERVVLIGPPNAGSLDALEQLIEGTKFGPLTPRYPPAVIATFPSVYQLLPRTRHQALARRGSGSDRRNGRPERRSRACPVRRRGTGRARRRRLRRR